MNSNIEEFTVAASNSDIAAERLFFNTENFNLGHYGYNNIFIINSVLPNLLNPAPFRAPMLRAYLKYARYKSIKALLCRLAQ